MSQQATQVNEEELADVVVAAQTHDAPLMPWYIALRPWLFCLAFLLLAELGTRAYFDTGICLQTERFDNFPTPALENAFVAQMKRDHAYKVVIIGDSTVVGAAMLPKEQSIAGYLEDELHARMPKRDIHVWNFGIAGARATDEYCVLQKVLEAKPDFLVIEGNYFITCSLTADSAIAEPWLAYNLPAIPEELRPYVKERDVKKRFEDALTWGVEDNFRLLGQRQAINAMLFGVQPRVPFSIPNPLVMTGVDAAKRAGVLRLRPWNVKGDRPESFISMYKGVITPENLNVRFYQRIMADAQRSGLPCVTYLTPQNPAITAVCVPPDAYRERRKILSSALSAPGVVCLDFSDLVADGLFTDNDHMFAEGNHHLATKLAAVIAPRAQNAISTMRRIKSNKALQ